MRFLLVSHLPQDARLGGASVHISFARELQRAGHEVCTLSRDDFNAATRWHGDERLFPSAFSHFVRPRLRHLASGFDVIDAFEGDIPFPKRAFGFHGLLVARSTGLSAIYAEFNRDFSKRWPDRSRGTLTGRLLRSRQERHYLRACAHSWRFADIVNVPNPSEREYLEHRGLRGRVLCVPYGLTQSRLSSLSAAAWPHERRLDQRRVAFIGIWSARKGAFDWAEIVRVVRAAVPDARFRFIGTWASSATILRDLELPGSCEWVEVVESYDERDLPDLLSDATVGAFPSYVEGFGIAPLEQLAARLPTIAYDVPGPRETVGAVDPGLLVEPGDSARFGAQLAIQLQQDVASYRALAQSAAQIASGYLWQELAERTVEAYANALLGSAVPVGTRNG